VTQPSAWALGAEADALAADGDWDGALGRACEAYQLEPTAFRASMILRTARKVGGDAVPGALTLGREALARWPGDEWLKRGVAWCLWSVWLKRHDQQVKNGHPLSPQAWSDVQDAIREVAGLGLPEGDPAREQAFLAGARLAKAVGDWGFILDLVDWFPAGTCSLESRRHEGRVLPSPREQWWGWWTRALLSTGRHAEALERSREAVAAFPGSGGLMRLEALALQANGRHGEAVQALSSLLARQPRQWYLAADLATAHEAAGNRRQALDHALSCLAMPGPIEGRIRVMEQASTWLAEAGRAGAALETCMLAWAIARGNSWERRIRAIEALMARHGWDRPHQVPRVGDQLRIARSHWSQGGQPASRSGPPPGEATKSAAGAPEAKRRMGTISQWHADRGFGFVKEQGGGLHFFMARDASALPAGPVVGQKVTCEIVPSFDRKKGKESTAARDLRPDA